MLAQALVYTTLENSIRKFMKSINGWLVVWRRMHYIVFHAYFLVVNQHERKLA